MVVLLKCAGVQVSIRHNHLIAKRAGLRHDFTGWRHDHTAAHQLKPVFATRLGDANDPGAVLISAHLHRHMVMHHAEVRRFWATAIAGWRVVAKHHQLNALQAHHPVCLRPAPVIAERHAHNAAHGPPDWPAKITHFEIALLKVLPWQGIVILNVARQMHLAILADNLARFINQNGGIEPAHTSFILKLLCVAQIKAHAVFDSGIEEWLCCWPRHFCVEPFIHMVPVLVIPAGEECGQRQFRECDEFHTLRMRLRHQIEHPLNHGFAAVRQLNWTHLSAAQSDDARHRLFL